MGIFTSKKNQNALVMTLRDEIVNTMAEDKTFSENEINIIPKAYYSAEDIINDIEEKNAEILFILDEVFDTEDESKYEIIKKIRDNNKNIRIVILLIYSNNIDEEFINWCWKMKVYDFFESNSGQFDFNYVLQRLNEEQFNIEYGNFSKQKDKELQNELEKKENALEKIKEESQRKDDEIAKLHKQVLKLQSINDKMTKKKEKEGLSEEEGQIYESQKIENEKAIENLINQIKKINEEKEQKDEDRKKLEYEIEEKNAELEEIKRKHEEAVRKIKENYEKEIKEKERKNEELQSALKRMEESKQIVKEKIKGQVITIGVFSLSDGAGATYTSIKLAEKFGKRGYKTLLLGMDGKEDLKYVNNTSYEIGYSDASLNNFQRSEMYMKAIGGKYEIVIIDFGVIFPLNSKGFVDFSKDISVSEFSAERDLLNRCLVKVAMGFSAPWHIGKINFFLDNDEFFVENTIFAFDKASEIKELQNIGLIIADKDEEEIFRDVNLLAGLNQEEKESKREKRFFSFLGR